MSLRGLPHGKKRKGDCRMAEKKRSILASASLVIVVMLASKLLGFVRQMVIAGAFGAGVETDLYFVSSDFMLNLSGALLSALTTALIARYIEIAVRESRGAANAVASQMLSLFLLMGAACILLINLFAPQAAHLLAPAYTGAEAEQLVRYLRFFSVAFVFTAFQSIYASVLNANERFIPGKLYGLVYNPVAIACVLLLAPRFGIRVLLWAYLAGNVLQTLLLRRCNRGVFAFRPALDLHDENIRCLVRVSVPLLLSNVFLQLNSIVDKVLCSYLGEGIASNYQYAYTLEQFVTSTITATLSLILLSRYSEYVAKDDTASLLRTFRQSVGGLVLFLTPIALLTGVFAYDLVSIVYLRGAFDAAAAEQTARALTGFAVGFPLVAMREMYIRLHLAYQDTRRPMLANVAAVALNAALSIALAPLVGIFGIALATSLSVLLTIALLDRSTKRYLPRFRFALLLPTLWRTALGGAAALCAALAVRGAVTVETPTAASLLARFLLASVCAAAVYLAVLLAARCPELTEGLAALRARLDKRRKTP